MANRTNHRTPDNALWSFRTANFVVAFFAEPEEMDPADSFQFEDDIEAVRNGDVEWFCAIVEVFDADTGEVLGGDALGGCAYESFREFYASHRTASADSRNTLASKALGRNFCTYFPGMVQQAIREARKAVAANKRRYASLHLRAVA